MGHQEKLYGNMAFDSAAWRWWERPWARGTTWRVTERRESPKLPREEDRTIEC